MAENIATQHLDAEVIRVPLQFLLGDTERLVAMLASSVGRICAERGWYTVADRLQVRPELREDGFFLNIADKDHSLAVRLEVDTLPPTAPGVH